MNTVLKTEALPQLFPYSPEDFADYEEYCEAKNNYALFLCQNGYALSIPHHEAMKQIAQEFGFIHDDF